MNRTNMWLAGMLGVQVVVFGTFFAFCGSTSSEKTERVLLLQNLTRDEIFKITLENTEGQSLELNRKEEKWLLPSKHDYPADTQKVNRLLSKLFGLESSYIVSTGADHHRKLEVDENNYRRKVTVESKGDKRVLFLGGTNTDNFASMRVLDDPKVLAVDGIKEWDLGTQMSDWAENPYFDVETNRVSGFELDRGAGNQVFVRQQLDTWMHDGKPVDGGKVDSWIGEVAKIHLTDILGRAEGSDVILEKMKKKKHRLKVTLRIEAQPIKSADSEKNALSDDDAGGPNEQNVKAGSSEEQKAPTEKKTITIAAGPDDDQEIIVIVEGRPFVVKVDRWRMRGILEADPKKLAQKIP